jgi:hypothetical protein
MIAAEPVDWPLALVGLPFGLLGTWVGIRAWQGRYPGPGGPTPTYQTWFGAAHVAALFGSAFALICGGELLRGMAGLGEDSALFWTTSVAGFLLLLAGAAYLAAFFTVGVPPRLRPPYQRSARRHRADGPSLRTRMRQP